MTRLVAEVAVETGIAPRFLLEDQTMLLTIVEVLRQRAEAAAK